MTLDYTLLNEPTKLLQRLADAEAKLAAVRLLINEWNAETFTTLLSEDPLTIYGLVADQLKAAIGEES